MLKNGKYKVCKKVFLGALFSSLALSSCSSKVDKYNVQFREKDYISFMLNPLDFSFDPDTAHLRLYENDEFFEVEYGIDEFFDKLNNSDEYFIVNDGDREYKIDKVELLDKSNKLLSNITSFSSIIMAKIVFIVTETMFLVCLVPLSYGVYEHEKTYKK